MDVDLCNATFVGKITALPCPCGCPWGRSSSAVQGPSSAAPTQAKIPLRAKVEIAKLDSDWHLVRSQESSAIKCFHFSKHTSVSEAYFSFQKCHFPPQLLTVSLTHRIILAAPNTCICMCKPQQHVKETLPKTFQSS